MTEPLSAILLKAFLTGGAAAGLALVCFLIVLLLRRCFYVEHKREHTIQVTNKGNARSIYQFALESVNPLAKRLPIKYQLLQSGIPLAELPPPQPAAPQTRHVAANNNAPAEEAPRAQNVPQAETAPKSNNRPAQTSAQPVGQTGAKPGADAKKAVESAKKSGKAVASVSGQAASVLGIIGSFLPGELGKTLKAQGQAARGVQTKTNEAMQAPDANMRKIDALKKEGGKLSGKAAPQAPQMRLAGSSVKLTSAARAVEPTTSTVSTVSTAPVDARASTPPQQAPVQAVDSPVAPRYDYYAQTGEVAPGETLTLTLRILWKQLRTPEGSQVYILHSQQVPVEKVSRTPIPPVSKQGSVYFAPLEPWRYWLPSLIYGFISLSGFLAFVGLCIVIW